MASKTKGKHQALKSHADEDDRIIPKPDPGECIVLYDDDTYDVAQYASFQILDKGDGK